MSFSNRFKVIFLGAYIVFSFMIGVTVFIAQNYKDKDLVVVTDLQSHEEDRFLKEPIGIIELAQKEP